MSKEKPNCWKCGKPMMGFPNGRFVCHPCKTERPPQADIDKFIGPSSPFITDRMPGHLEGSANYNMVCEERDYWHEIALQLGPQLHEAEKELAAVRHEFRTANRDWLLKAQQYGVRIAELERMADRLAGDLARTHASLGCTIPGCSKETCSTMKLLAEYEEATP